MKRRNIKAVIILISLAMMMSLSGYVFADETDEAELIDESVIDTEEAQNDETSEETDASDVTNETDETVIQEITEPSEESECTDESEE